MSVPSISWSLFLTGFFCLSPLPVGAQENTESTQDGVDEELALLREEDIVYTAAKHQQSIGDSPSSITVITREQIQNTHCNDVSCLLNQVPELEVMQITPGFHSVGARALVDTLCDKGLLLIDGQEMNIEVFGMPFYSALPVHLEDIERIEIIRGPGSALYGADAHSMVISIATRKADQSRVEAFVGGGEHDRNSLHLRLDQLMGGFRLQVAGGMDTADNWRIRGKKERDVYRIGLKLQYQWNASNTTSLHLGWVDAAAVIFTSFGHAAIDTGSGHLMLLHESGWFHARVFFNYRKSDWVFDLPLYYRGILLGTMVPNVPLLDTNLDGDAQFNWSPWASNLLLGGVNYRWLTMSSSLNDPTDVYQHRLGFYFQDEQRLWEQLLLTASVRFDLNSITPFTISPRLAMVWRFTQQQLVRFTFGQAFRKPSFFNTSLHLQGVKGTSSFPELGDFFKRNISNENLNNESVNAVELGYRGGFIDNTLTVEGDVFFNLYRDRIETVADIVNSSIGLPDLTRSKFIYENGSADVDSLGGSISVTQLFTRRWRVNLNYTYRYSWYINTPNSSLSSGAKKGDRVEWEPAHLLNLSLTYQADTGLRCGLAAHARSSFADLHVRDGSLFGDNIRVENPAYVVFSGFVSWRAEMSGSWLEIGFRVYNILNAGIRDLTAIKRFDGAEIGGELQGREAFLFLRGGLLQ